MDMFLLAVRFLGAMAELKEMTHKNWDNFSMLMSNKN